MRLYIRILIAGLFCATSFVIPTSIAIEYEITFTGTWSASDVEPGTYPSASAHFTPLIGAFHQAGAEFWKNNGQASAGVEVVAEVGINSTLRSELAAARRAGTTGSVIEFQDLFNLPNSSTVRIDVDSDKPFVTLIAMIAPSPDWFVGVSGLSLLDDNDGWVKNVKVSLRPYDAGTEEGETFSLSNAASPVTDTIFRLTGNDSPFIGRPSIGTLEFTLLNPPPQSVGKNASALSVINSLLLGE